MARGRVAAIGGACLALGICGAYGFNTGAQFSAGPVSFAGTGWTDARCSACHQIDHALSHPVGFVPERPLPAEFPLEGGRTTCLTCHTESATRSHPGDGGGLLRTGPSGTMRCGGCHDGQVRGHALSMSSAHLGWSASDGAPRHAASGRDTETRTCLECHDGTVAADAGSHRVGGGFRTDAEHPVGIRYRTRPSRGVDQPPLHPVRALDERIRLFDGTVGCGSCHSLYSPLPGRLVMDNHASALCMSCHAY